MKFLILFIIYFIYSLAISEEKLGTVEVIGISPLPGILIEKNKHPSSSQSINQNEIKKNLAKTLADLMNENLSGVTVKDVQNGSFQKTLITEVLLHPLLGESQGITVYLDGVRINESFGDTVQWELIPEYAQKKLI